MYDDAYGTDWAALEADEAVERAYALGVSTTLGEPHEDELHRLVGAVETAHDRAMVSLAYEKGRTRARTVRARTDDDSAAVWTSLLDESEREIVSVPASRDLPPALRGPSMLDPPGDDLDRVRLPRFLTRR